MKTKTFTTPELPIEIITEVGKDDVRLISHSAEYHSHLTFNLPVSALKEIRQACEDVNRPYMDEINGVTVWAYWREDVDTFILYTQTSPDSHEFYHRSYMEIPREKSVGFVAMLNDVIDAMGGGESE